MHLSDLSKWLADRVQMEALVRQHLLRAHQRMKDSVDKRRSDRSFSMDDRFFSMDDWVFLKLQPYVQRSVATRTNQKLAFRCFGPFKILERIGAVAYKHQLPQASTIHPVFHVSQLRRALPPMEQAQQQLSSTGLGELDGPTCRVCGLGGQHRAPATLPGDTSLGVVKLHVLANATKSQN